MFFRTGLLNWDLNAGDDALGGVGVCDAVSNGLNKADAAVSAVTLYMKKNTFQESIFNDLKSGFFRFALNSKLL